MHQFINDTFLHVLVEDWENFEWVEDGTGICYHIHGQYTAADAETYCQAIGGHLAVLESVKDQVFLVGLWSAFYSIGSKETTEAWVMC